MNIRPVRSAADNERMYGEGRGAELKGGRGRHISAGSTSRDMVARAHAVGPAPGHAAPGTDAPRQNVIRENPPRAESPAFHYCPAYFFDE
jgi:hypothetical protein